jgi:hypothetical protein
MEAKIKECDEKAYVLPGIGLKHHAQVDKGLGNLFREFEEASKYANTLCPDCEEDEMFMEIFIEYVTKRLQTHIGQTIGKVVKPGKRKKTMLDENKLPNKANNLIRLSKLEEFRTKTQQIKQ